MHPIRLDPYHLDITLKNANRNATGDGTGALAVGYQAASFDRKLRAFFEVMAKM